MIKNRPSVSDEQPPEGTERTLSEYLMRRFRQAKFGLMHIYRWADEHLLNPNPHGMMRYAGLWQSGFKYKQHDVVVDDGWPYIALVDDTLQKPAPQPTGPATWAPDLTTFGVANEFFGLVYAGHEYITTKPLWLQSIQVWVPELTEDTNYRIVIANLTDIDNPIVVTIEEPVLGLNQWTAVALNNTGVPTGSRLIVYLDALNSGGTAPPVEGGWLRSANSNNANPAAQSWNMNTQKTILRIDKTDLDSTDRTTELLNIIPGSVISWTENAVTSRSLSFYVSNTTDNGSAVVYDGSITLTGPSGEPNVGADCSLTTDIPQPQNTKYVEELGHWPTNQPDWATVRGLQELNGTPQTVPDTAFGVRLLAQEAALSDEWDALAPGGLANRAATRIVQERYIAAAKRLAGL